jgi:Fic family protein
MKWVWEQDEWPDFHYESEKVASMEKRFLLASGEWTGVLSQLDKEDERRIRVLLLTDEAMKTSEIEAEILDKDSLQSSIQRQFGIHTDMRTSKAREQGMAELMVEVYRNFDSPLSHYVLHQWHQLVMAGSRGVRTIGEYRKGVEAMQVVSGAIHDPTVHYQAPPSAVIPELMEDFVRWFNDSELPVTVKAALVHLRFEQMHPFEDGNGRLGRALAELAISQAVGKPMLLSLSTVITVNKKRYYDELHLTNTSLEVTRWVEYFVELVIEAQKRSRLLLDFILKKSNLLKRVEGQINDRQEKVVLRLFDAGIDGFEGGLSSKNYQSITKASSATATRDLRDLVEKRVLIKTGENKNARYWLNISE